METPWILFPEIALGIVPNFGIYSVLFALTFSVCTSLFPVCPGSIIDSQSRFDRSSYDRSYLGDLPLRACDEICDMLNQNVKWNGSRIELFPD